MKKLVIALAVTALCAGSAFASGKHHNKTRKGEVAAGIAAGVTAALFGTPEPAPPPPPPQTVVVQQPVVTQPVVVQQPVVAQPVVVQQPVVAQPVVAQPVVVPAAPPPPAPVRRSFW